MPLRRWLVTDEQRETTETPGEAFDRGLIEDPLAELEEFIAGAPQLLSTKPLEFLRDCKARVDARLNAEPVRRVYMGRPHEIRVIRWREIADRLEAEINWRTARETQNASGHHRKALRRGAQKEPAVAARRTIVRQNAEVTDKELCQILDRENIALPRRWEGAGFKTWSTAWTARQREIHVIFSKDRKPG
jgi:hypothetical protein